MKKLLLTLSLIVLAVSSYAQGQINLGNVSNSGTGPTATTGGLFWLCLPNGGGVGGSSLSLIATDFNVNFYGGSDANSLTLLKSLVSSGGGAAGGPGTFLDLSGQPVSIPGTLTSGFFRIEAWTGGSTFTTATLAGSSAVFSNPLGNPTASPPGTPTDFTGMPAIILKPYPELVCVPEPSPLGLVGLGAGALLVLRRHRFVKQG